MEKFTGFFLGSHLSDLIYPRFLPMNARTDVPSPEDFGIPDHAYEHATIQTPDHEKLDVIVLRPNNCPAAQAKKPQRARTDVNNSNSNSNKGERSPSALARRQRYDDTNGPSEEIFTKKSNQFLRGADWAASSASASTSAPAPSAAMSPSSRNRADKTGSGRWRDPRITMLMFHGNAGNIGHRIPIARSMVNTLNCNVVMLEYRGYGLSTGKPDERGLKIDAQAGLDWILSQEEFRDTQVVVYGQSLGGAVAISLAEKNQDVIAALVLENTFLSVKKMVPRFVSIPLFSSATSVNHAP